MGSWWAFCIQKEGLEFGRKMKGIFGLILYAPSWARKRRLYYLWLLSGASKPSQGFSPFLEGKSIFFRKKRKPCLSPHARGFLFCVLILYGVRVFEILRFFMKTPGWVMHGFRRYKLNVLMYSYLWFCFWAFWFFLRKKAKYVRTKRRCISQSPFFQKRAFSFIYLAKTEGLWSRKVKTLSGTKAPPFYWEIWAQKPFFRKKGFAICIGFQSFLLRGNCES